MLSAPRFNWKNFDIPKSKHMVSRFFSIHLLDDSIHVYINAELFPFTFRSYCNILGHKPIVFSL